MAILAYEGLPGAGKSYEAMCTQIIPFLKKGRHVVCYIEGLNFERIAEASELPLERVQELLHPLTREDMEPREVTVNGKVTQIDGLWITKTLDNAFHVFDEAQNWWPVKHKATKELTQFVTEHRHRGIDVLLMGQSLKDIFTLWRRRVDQKFTFLKLTALGSSKRYRVTIWKGQGNDEFVKVSDKISKYDPAYFGTYSSHVSSDTNTETYTDSRVSFFGGTMVKLAVPMCILFIVFGVWKAYSFFRPAAPAVAAADLTAKPIPVAPAFAAPPVQLDASGVPIVEKKPDARSPQEKYFADLDTKYRIRLAGLMQLGKRTDGVVEWVDSGSRVMERMSLDQLRDLGVAVMQTRSVVRLNLDGWVALATMWPIEDQIGRTSESQLEKMRTGERPGLPGQSPNASPLAFTLVSSNQELPRRAVEEPVGAMVQHSIRRN